MIQNKTNSNSKNWVSNFKNKMTRDEIKNKIQLKIINVNTKNYK
jgi:hypothetical protein